jgi:hypothetical protein
MSNNNNFQNMTMNMNNENENDKINKLSQNSENEIKGLIKKIKLFTENTSGQEISTHYEEKQELMANIKQTNTEIEDILKSLSNKTGNPIENLNLLKNKFDKFNVLKNKAVNLQDKYAQCQTATIEKLQTILDKEKDNKKNVNSFISTFQKESKKFTKNQTHITKIVDYTNTVYEKYKNTIKDIYTELFTVFNNELGRYQIHKDKFIKLTQEVLNFEHTDNITGQIQTIKEHKLNVTKISNSTSGIFNIIKSINDTINIGIKPINFNNNLNHHLDAFYEQYKNIITTTLANLRIEHAEYNNLCQQLKNKVIKIKEFKKASRGNQFNEGMKRLLNEYDTLIKTNKECQGIGTAVGAAMGTVAGQSKVHSTKKYPVNYIPSPNYSGSNTSNNSISTFKPKTSLLNTMEKNNTSIPDLFKQQNLKLPNAIKSESKETFTDENEKFNFIKKILLTKNQRKSKSAIITTLQNLTNKNVTINNNHIRSRVASYPNTKNNRVKIKNDEQYKSVVEWCIGKKQELIDYLNKP